MFVRTKFNVCKNQKITRTTFAVINTLVSQYSKCKKTFSDFALFEKCSDQNPIICLKT